MEKNHICKKCGGIAGWDSYFQSWICTRCGNEEPKHITNADCIRSMSDEELANLFDTWIRDCNCNDVPCRIFCQQGCFNCKKNWLNWLKQEVEEE